MKTEPNYCGDLLLLGREKGFGRRTRQRTTKFLLYCLHIEIYFLRLFLYVIREISICLNENWCAFYIVSVQEYILS